MTDIVIPGMNGLELTASKKSGNKIKPATRTAMSMNVDKVTT